ncbi:hypothetical protein BDW69DRAFT_180331 [Aspergillus filifer]
MPDFNFSITASSVIERWGSSLPGETVVITGASTRTLGGETAIALASAVPIHEDNTAPASAPAPTPTPTTLILLSRSIKNVHPVLTRITQTSPTTKNALHPHRPLRFRFQRQNIPPLSAYAQSKTSNILSSVMLAERYAEDVIRAFAVHPRFIPGTFLLSHLDTIDGDEMNRVRWGIQGCRS